MNKHHLFPEEEARIWRRVTMVRRPQPAIGELKKRRHQKKLLVCSGKEDILHYLNSQIISEELPSTDHLRHLEK